MPTWDPWHPRVVADRLAGLDAPWCVAAGWAVDLFLGRPTRPHGDLEITVPANRFADVAARFPDCAFSTVRAGTVTPATPDSLRASHQTWALETAAGVWRFDVFREPYDADGWVYRRDRRVRRPYAELIRTTADGVPYLAPEVVLLFKAKAPRDKDEADFRAVLPALGADGRRWLDGALGLTDPAHPWRTALYPSARPSP
jgi:hypothetical protein